MEAKFRIGEKVKIANHPDKSKIGKEVEIINLHHSNFNPQKGYVDEWLYNVWDGAKSYRNCHSKEINNDETVQNQ